MLTNKLNLPEPFLRAAEAAAYSKGEAQYSVTELIKPVRLGALSRLYRDVIVEDVADCMPSLMGRMFHLMLEKAGAPVTKAILEERLYANVNGVVISGAMDHTVLWTDGPDKGTLDDYKSCSVYSVTKGTKFEWEAQLNIYHWLRSLQGQSVDRLRIIAWMKDWFVSRAIASVKSGGNYPEHEIAVIEVPMWDFKDTEQYVAGRIAAHQAADVWAHAMSQPGVASAEPEPQCSDEDRWRDKIRWAVMKTGRKTAIKLYDTEAEANFIAAQQKGGYVEVRGGTYKRCLLYCPPGRAGLCGQWERDKAANPTAGEVDTSAFE